MSREGGALEREMRQRQQSKGSHEGSSSPLRAASSRTDPSGRNPAVIARLLEDVASGIQVLATRDGVALSQLQVWERARNIVAGLMGNYRIVSFDEDEEDAPAPAEPRHEHEHEHDDGHKHVHDVSLRIHGADLTPQGGLVAHPRSHLGASEELSGSPGRPAA